MARKVTGKRSVGRNGSVRVHGKASNGEDSVYLDSDGAWRATYVAPGSARPKRVRGKTREEAIARQGREAGGAVADPVVDVPPRRHGRRAGGVVARRSCPTPRASLDVGHVQSARRADQQHDRPGAGAIVEAGAHRSLAVGPVEVRARVGTVADVRVTLHQVLERHRGGTLLDRPYTLASVNDPAHQPDDLDIDAAAFWLDTDLATMLATVKPYEGPDEFVIHDLTDDEWDRFVAALSE